jgi:hypothetical protein
VRQTELFRDWLSDLRDAIAVKSIKRRIARVQIGLFGDAKSVGDGIHELRIAHCALIMGRDTGSMMCGAEVFWFICSAVATRPAKRET